MNDNIQAEKKDKKLITLTNEKVQLKKLIRLTNKKVLKRSFTLAKTQLKNFNIKKQKKKYTR